MNSGGHTHSVHRGVRTAGVPGVPASVHGARELVRVNVSKNGTQAVSCPKGRVTAALRGAPRCASSQPGTSDRRPDLHGPQAREGGDCNSHCAGGETGAETLNLCLGHFGADSNPSLWTPCCSDAQRRHVSCAQNVHHPYFQPQTPLPFAQDLAASSRQLSWTHFAEGGAPSGLSGWHLFPCLFLYQPHLPEGRVLVLFQPQRTKGGSQEVERSNLHRRTLDLAVCSQTLRLPGPTSGPVFSALMPVRGFSCLECPVRPSGHSLRPASSWQAFPEADGVPDEKQLSAWEIIRQLPHIAPGCARRSAKSLAHINS